jgi:transcriptional regulator with XRE-family HTH domain
LSSGLLLRSFRSDLDLSLETTADAAGVHPNYLGEVERGKRNISLFNIWRLAGSARRAGISAARETSQAQSQASELTSSQDGTLGAVGMEATTLSATRSRGALSVRSS